MGIACLSIGKMESDQNWTPCAFWEGAGARTPRPNRPTQEAGFLRLGNRRNSGEKSPG